MLDPAIIALIIAGVFVLGVLHAALWGIRGAIILFVWGPAAAGIILGQYDDYGGQSYSLEYLFRLVVSGFSVLFFLGLPAFFGAAVGIFITGKTRRFRANS